MEIETVQAGESERVTRAAALISFGSVASRALGLAREMVKSYFFGAGGIVSAFDIASQVPTMLYDLLAGGMINSALVPVFSDYARPGRRQELWQLVALLFTFLTLLLGGFILIIEIGAPWIVQLLGGGLPPEYLKLATALLRITAPAILFLNVAGLFSGVLYALQRFERPAFTAAIYNATMVLLVVLLGGTALGVRSLALGLLAGSAAQVAFQWPALRDVHLRFRLHSHPALATLGRLYLPIGLGLVVDQLTVTLSFYIASLTGPSGIAWMKYAATLIQFPLGMVVTAVSIAILPTLSRYAADAAEEPFRATLAQGLRLVLILVVPAAFALLVLAEPVVALLFQHGSFTAQDTAATAEALRFNLLGLVFAALDQPLIFAFYARKNTWTPALVGVATTVLYALLALAPTWLHTPRLWELILANSLKLMAHALLMLALFHRQVGSLRPYRVGRTTWLALLAATAMTLPMAGLRLLLQSGALGGMSGFLLEVVVPGGVGALLYLWLIGRVGVEEVALLRRALLKGRNTGEPRR